MRRLIRRRVVGSIGSLRSQSATITGWHDTPVPSTPGLSVKWSLSGHQAMETLPQPPAHSSRTLRRLVSCGRSSEKRKGSCWTRPFPHLSHLPVFPSPRTSLTIPELIPPWKTIRYIYIYISNPSVTCRTTSLPIPKLTQPGLTQATFPLCAILVEYFFSKYVDRPSTKYFCVKYLKPWIRCAYSSGIFLSQM